MDGDERAGRLSQSVRKYEAAGAATPTYSRSISESESSRKPSVGGNFFSADRSRGASFGLSLAWL
jgi:hypothetical protein